MSALTTEPLTDGPVQLSNSVGAIYTNPSGDKTLIASVMVHNTNSTAETVDIWWVPDNAGAVGTAADAKRIARMVLPAGDTQFFDLAYPIILKDTNDTIQASSTTINKSNAVVFGARLVP